MDDLLQSFGFQDARRGRALLRALFYLPARRFAGQMAAFDERVGRVGLQVGSAETLTGYSSPVEVYGLEHIPTQGPLLVLSNHPGMTDTLVLFSTLPRADLKVVAAERPFLKALQNVSQQLIYVAEDATQRMGVVRAATGHLRRDGAILTFPAGEIEPDPASMPGAAERLAHWSESIAVFARLVPDLQILTAIVSGVIWPRALTHPLTRLRRLPQDRERLGATLQILIQTLLPFYHPITTRVAYSLPLCVRDHDAGRDSTTLLSAIRAQGHELIRSLPNPARRQVKLPARELHPV